VTDPESFITFLIHPSVVKGGRVATMGASLSLASGAGREPYMSALAQSPAFSKVEQAAGVSCLRLKPLCVCACVCVCVCVCVSGCVVCVVGPDRHHTALLVVFTHIHRSVIFGLCHTSLCVLRVRCVDINCGLGAVVLPSLSLLAARLRSLVGRNVSK
jgi:hypothetical protein